ncbi:NCS cytosine-purine permease [Atractiella rhizophila]|nr:NCS cytosine-purine permease [Atractiella rhizophila]
MSKDQKNLHDLEKTLDHDGKEPTFVELKEVNKFESEAWHKRALKWGIESRGIAPVPVEQRTDTSYNYLFWLWFSISFNLLPIVTGSLATLVYGLSLRNACLIILFFSLICTIPPAYAITLGPKTGMRQMIQARYSFGYWAVAAPSVLNCCTLMGYAIVTCILGGQTLASVNAGLTWDVGIVVVAVTGLVIAFFGNKALQHFERVTWATSFIAIVVAAGTGGSHLHDRVEPEPVTARSIFSFASLIGGFLLTWTPIASDYSIYYIPTAPSKRLFLYTYAGLFLATVTLMCFGAAIGASIPTDDNWMAGYERGGIGGAIHEMLRPAGGFGDFLTVLIALSIIGNLGVTFYSFSLNCQICVPWLVRVPRYIFIIFATAVVIPLSIVAANHFYAALENFLGLIGYWSAMFIPIVLEEFLIFRKRDVNNFDLNAWNDWRRLPSGIAAISAAICSLGLVVPSMDQVWYTGPIAKHTGDLGFEFALIITGILYPVFRLIEINIQGRH